jgi:hypothetical protein
VGLFRGRFRDAPSQCPSDPPFVNARPTRHFHFIYLRLTRRTICAEARKLCKGARSCACHLVLCKRLHKFSEKACTKTKSVLVRLYTVLAGGLRVLIAFRGTKVSLNTARKFQLPPERRRRRLARVIVLHPHESLFQPSHAAENPAGGRFPLENRHEFLQHQVMRVTQIIEVCRDFFKSHQHHLSARASITRTHVTGAKKHVRFRSRIPRRRTSTHRGTSR